MKAALAAQVNDAVTEWNQEAVRLTLLPASALAPVQQTRVMAIAQVAVHDAVNGLTGKYATYLSPGPAPQNASPEAAAIAAAHHALRNLFANQVTQVARLDALYLDSLAAHGLSAGDPGVEYGRDAAAAVLAARANDLSAQAQYPYAAPGAGSPGVWVPISSAASAQALLPGWGSVTPFVLRSGSQFRPEPPPALDSEQYAKDYNEVQIIGASNSPLRTAEQTQIARFWLASPTAIWNPVLSQVIATRGLDLSAKARAFALFYLAASDASVACWDAKYVYNFWRPQFAIRGGDSDGNDLTAGDAAWTPLHSTPRHPEYPSGHASNSGAMAAILGHLFGDDPGTPVEVTLSGITRQWDTFSEGVEEVIDARVYSGVHYRTADEVGARMGRQVAHFVSTHALRSCRKGRSHCS
ncbi:MAG: vanadium-dependent haloperoxidase [Acidobacteria bacterium]|nr:vanadium-dependent haloperoxidase [Acidobacteriota bacterium]MCA1640923.1 vanadium-dependent haloperoxidase [Acidobacteriota bacterium]